MLLPIDDATLRQHFLDARRPTSVKSNFLCNIGYGDPAGVQPRSPRFTFDEMAKIV